MHEYCNVHGKVRVLNNRHFTTVDDDKLTSLPLDGNWSCYPKSGSRTMVLAKLIHLKFTFVNLTGKSLFVPFGVICVKIYYVILNYFLIIKDMSYVCDKMRSM